MRRGCQARLSGPRKPDPTMISDDTANSLNITQSQSRRPRCARRTKPRKGNPLGVNMANEWWDVDQAAAHAKCGKGTIYPEVRRGRLRGSAAGASCGSCLNGLTPGCSRRVRRKSSTLAHLV